LKIHTLHSPEQKTKKNLTLFKNVAVNNGGLNDEQTKIITLIEKHPGINTKQIQELSHIPQRTLERWLGELKNQQIIVYKGSKKTGGYYINQESKNINHQPSTLKLNPQPLTLNP
jgi:predicted HTH transcriptional regulator